MRLYIEALRYEKASDGETASLKLRRRASAVRVCIVAKAVAAFALALGSVFIALALTKL